MIPALFALLGMGGTPALTAITEPLGPPESGMTKWRRTRGGYGNQSWRTYWTPQGWRLDFKRARNMALPGQRWARKNRRWLAGDNPKKRFVRFGQPNPQLSAAA